MKTDTFTEEEIRYLKEFSLKQSGAQKLYFYICILLAPLGFAVYGFAKEDVLAMLIAFSAIIIVLIWFLSLSFKGEKILNSVCEKIIEDLE